MSPSPSSFYTHLIFLSPEISSFHSFVYLILRPSLLTPLCQYLHPHPSIFGCSSRPPANPLISSHLCLSPPSRARIHQHNANVRACSDIRSATHVHDILHCSLLALSVPILLTIFKFMSPKYIHTLTHAGTRKTAEIQGSQNVTGFLLMISLIKSC